MLYAILEDETVYPESSEVSIGAIPYIAFIEKYKAIFEKIACMVYVIIIT